MSKIGILAGTWLLALSPLMAQNVVVSPQGPIKTLMQARDAVRAQRKAGVKGTITITIHGGTYYLPETFKIDPQDSDTVWQAPHGEHVVISGGVVITGWKKNGNVWTAPVPPNSNFHQLFVDGRRATRARTPNSGFFTWAGKSQVTDPSFLVRYNGNDIKKDWANKGVEVVALELWSDLRMPITNINEGSHTAMTAAPALAAKQQQASTARYYIENAPDALDAPGEWYLDKSKWTISYIPTANDNIEHSVFVAASLGKLVLLEGNAKANQIVRNVTFRGLKFAHADWSMGPKGYPMSQAGYYAPWAIEVGGADHFTMDHCTVEHSGGYGIFLRYGTQHSQIISNEFTDLGGGGVRVGEDFFDNNNPATAVTDNTIADNVIHDLGKVYAGAVGVWVVQSSNNQVVHNDIYDLYYSGISAGWTWGYGATAAKGNVISYNHVHNFGKGMLSDMGGIYTLGVQPGTVIQNNRIHDVSAAEYGAWGIYLDEGSSNILIQNNIVYNCQSAGLHLHYGQDNIIRNNIFAYNVQGELQRTTADNRNAFTIEHNIFLMSSGGLLESNWNAKQGPFQMRNNLYWDTRSKPINFAGHSLAQWQASGQDQGSIIADPHFVNPAAHDFRLQANSPASKIGFQQIDMSTVGPRGTSGVNNW